MQIHLPKQSADSKKPKKQETKRKENEYHVYRLSKNASKKKEIPSPLLETSRETPRRDTSPIPNVILKSPKTKNKKSARTPTAPPPLRRNDKPGRKKIPPPEKVRVQKMLFVFAQSLHSVPFHSILFNSICCPVLCVVLISKNRKSSV
jgi:hypothetical protein